MSRAFSTAAKALLKFVWDGMVKEVKWEDATRNFIENSPKIPHIETAKVKGKPHTSTDPLEHVSMVLYDEKNVRITSAHVYEDGTGKFSKHKYN
ncbi:MAG: hypothetical protein L6R35_004905 [Caloplaca aegaea]|nr:MAG: hypothetical protein L6R35_004905 [Caloplaca aegaea]